MKRYHHAAKHERDSIIKSATTPTRLLNYLRSAIEILFLVIGHYIEFFLSLCYLARYGYRCDR